MDKIRLSRLAISLLVLVSFFAAIPSSAQQVTTTRNAFVSADVFNASGIIGVYVTGAKPKEVLTNQSHSYLTVEVGNVFYTNNDNGPTTLEPSGTPAAAGHVVDISTSGSTRLLGDTIRTIWQPEGPSAFDFVQDVYPVTGVSEGQIVYKWSVVNHEDTALPAQVQYLLDLEASSNNPSHSTENPGVTTRAGFNAEAWQDITAMPYFVTTEYDLCNGSSNFPGVLGAGFTVDSLAPFPMGLIKPSKVVLVDWPVIAANDVFGFPPNELGTLMGDEDNAMLYQWPAAGIASNSEEELARTSFGTAPCQPVTFGNLDAMVLHRDHIVWDGTEYVPNHFPVEAIVWNPHDSITATRASATQSISNSKSGLLGPVQIVSPSATEFLQSNGHTDSTVFSCSSANATWKDTVLQSVLTNCSTDLSYDISFTVSASGIPQPIFGFGVPVCPVLVDCEEKDLTPPMHSSHIFSDTNHCGNPTRCQFSVFDSLSTDVGIQSITYTITPNPNAIQVISAATITGCPGIVGPVTLTQEDTLRDACVYFTFSDCAGNMSFDTVCFAACTPPPDTPIIVAGDLNFGNVPVGDTFCRSVRIHNIGSAPLIIKNSLLQDTLNFSFLWSARPDDTIPPGGIIQIALCFHPQTRGSFQTRIIWTTNVPTPLTYQNKDTSLLYGNGVDAGVNSLSPNFPFALSISPNPASGAATISLTGAPSANVEIFDVLGREVANFRVAESYEWQMGALPAGTYIVRAEAEGTVISRRVVKE